MNEKEKEKIEQDRIFKQEKEKRIKKERRFFMLLFLVLTLVIILMLSVLIYFITTAEKRAENKFDNDLLAVFSLVLSENEKKDIDPYYNYYGLDASLRQSSKQKEYEDISKILQTDINEDFYILSDEELKYLGVNDVSGLYLVNYDQALVFSLNPFEYKDGTIKYTLDKLLIHYTVAHDIDGSGANAPKLLEGMTPVIYNEDFEYWDLVIDVEEEDWYNYEKKIWANVMLQDYTDNNIDNLDGSMFVWIPRYAYKISPDNYHTSSYGIIDIKFLVDDTNVAYDGTPIDPNNTNSSKDYVVHPAFRAFGEVSGIWVSKFEASTHEYGQIGQGNNDTNTTNLTYKSYYDCYSWTNIDMNNQFTVSKNMVNNYIYGLNSEQANTHMMKNTEWGAVAYLTQSTYGRNNNEIWSNNYYDQNGTKTGYSARSSSDKKYGSSIDDVTFLWNSSNGVKASTTGNVYGVYDMVGGAIERMAAYLNNNSKSLNEFGKVLVEQTNKDYVDIYNVGSLDTQIANYDLTRYKFGDAIYETSLYGHGNSKTSWYFASSGMMNNAYPFIFRGGAGVIREENIVGLYYYSPSSGGINALSSFRVVITEK